MRDYYERNKDRARTRRRAWYDANIDHVKRRERSRFYRKAYGITIEDYDAMLAAQGGCCRICGSDRPANGHKHFAVDHCHATGRARGLLCCSCNVALGWYERHSAKLPSYLREEL